MKRYWIPLSVALMLGGWWATSVTCAAGDDQAGDLRSIPGDPGVGISQRMADRNPPLPGEVPEDYERRLQREKAERALEQSIKIVVVSGFKWKGTDGEIEVSTGQVLTAQKVENGNYIIRYRGTKLLLPLDHARQTPYTDQELAARRIEIQRMYDSADQLRELQEQTRILDSIQHELVQIRHEADR